MTTGKKQVWGLAGLYGLLVVATALVHQLRYFQWAKFWLVLVILGIVVFWRYLLKRKIIGIGLFSMPAQLGLPKNERRFLYGLAFLVAPVFKLRDLFIKDVLLSVGILLVAVILCVMDERYFAKQGI